MLSPKYYGQLLEDIKKAHNPNPPANLDDLFAIKEKQEEEQDHFYFEEDEEPLTEIDTLEQEMSDEEILAEEQEEQDMIKHLEEVDAYLNFNEEENDPFGVSIGLDKSIFPKSDFFTESQLQEVISEFKNMLRSHRVSADIPNKLDDSKKYTLLISILDDTLFLPHSGIISWDCCKEDSSTCPYGEYCTCKKIEREIENENSFSKSALRALRSTLNDFMAEEKYFKYEIDHTLIGDDDNLSMFISHGVPDIPMNVSFFRKRWKDTIIDLKRYLKNYPQIAELFDEDDPMECHQILEEFLSLSTGNISRSYFRVEPFYIEYGQIFKGYKSPDVNLFMDEDNPPDTDPLGDEDLPF